MRTLLLLPTVVWTLSLAASAGAATYIIKPDGSGDFPTIQAGIVAASAGDVLELTDGTFTGNGNRDIDYLGKAIAIRSQSANPATCILDCAGTLDSPHRGVYFHSGETAASLLEGVTVKNGFTPPDTPLPTGSGGAGVLCTDNSNPTLTNCVFLQNIAGGTGGGMFCIGSSPTLERCTFSGNRSQSGGGALFYASSNATLDRCIFAGNSSGGAGGGMACGSSSPTLTECTFSANSSGKSGGATWCTTSSNPTFSGCHFLGNTAGDTWTGGGISCESASSPRVEGCTFDGNLAGYGGGLAIQSLSAPVIANCSFRRNRAAQIGGGIFCGDTSSPQLERCTLSGNSAQSGGGVGCLGSATALVTNCTLSGNSATRGSGFRISGTLTLANTIIAFGLQGEAMFGAGTSLSLTCCDLFGNAGGDWVGAIAPQLGVDGNLSEDPLFCDRSNENFGLAAGSPCAPDHNPACGLIGAWPAGCSTPVHPTSWGRVKDSYRQ